MLLLDIHIRLYIHTFFNTQCIIYLIALSEIQAALSSIVFVVVVVGNDDHFTLIIANRQDSVAHVATYRAQNVSGGKKAYYAAHIEQKIHYIVCVCCPSFLDSFFFFLRDRPNPGWYDYGGRRYSESLVEIGSQNTNMG